METNEQGRGSGHNFGGALPLSNDEIIRAISTFSNGYVKPDAKATESGNTTGFVRDTKDFRPFIFALSDELCRRAGVDCEEYKRAEEEKEKENKRRRRNHDYD